MVIFFFFQAEDGIRDLVRSRGLGDVYKRQLIFLTNDGDIVNKILRAGNNHDKEYIVTVDKPVTCLLYTSDAADERSSVDLGGRRIIKKKKRKEEGKWGSTKTKK